MGLTSTGYVATTLPEILSRVESAARLRFGNDIDMSPQSIFGGLKDIFSNELAIAYEEEQAIYAAGSVNSAEGVQLDDLCSLNGISRNGATKSFLSKQYFIGDDSTIVPAGTQIYNSTNPDIIFQTREEITLVTGTDEAQSGTLSVGWETTYQQFRLKHGNYTTNWMSFFASSSDIELELNSLPSIDTVTVVTTGQPKITVTFGGWSGKQPQIPLYCEIRNAPGFNFYFNIDTAGVEQGSVAIESVLGGSDQIGLAYNIKDLVTPVSGVFYTINTEDIKIGKNIETDAQLVARRNLSMSAGSMKGKNGLITRLLDQVPELDAVTVVENKEDVADGDGRPPHSFEVYVYSSAGISGNSLLQQAIADVILENTPPGIKNVVTASVNYSIGVLDESGISRTVPFSEPDPVDIYVDILVSISTSLFPVDGTQQIVNKILDYGYTLGVGSSVIYSPYLVGALLGIQGIKSSTVYCGLSSSPTGQSDITIGSNQVSNWSSSRITVRFA